MTTKKATVARVCTTDGCVNQGHVVQMPNNGAPNYCGVCGALMGK